MLYIDRTTFYIFFYQQRIFISWAPPWLHERILRHVLQDIWLWRECRSPYESPGDLEKETLASELLDHETLASELCENSSFHVTVLNITTEILIFCRPPYLLDCETLASEIIESCPFSFGSLNESLKLSLSTLVDLSDFSHLDHHQYAVHKPLLKIVFSLMFCESESSM